MTTRVPTLKDLFAAGEAGARRSDAAPPPVPRALAAQLGPFSWKDVCAKTGDLLDVNVADVLAGGWNKVREVRQRLVESRLDPTRTVLLHLGTHTITSEHHPSLGIRVDGRQVAELVFLVAVEFEIEAVELTLRAGEIQEARTGDVRAKGTVRLDEAVLFERQSAPLPLPGRIVYAARPDGALAEVRA